MNIPIRQEQPQDYDTVEQITREAFWNLYRPGCEEHLIVHKLRKHPDFIPELAFVIELEAFDKKFPPKEKAVTPSQAEFEQASAALYERDFSSK